jgi:hypothetical protein
MVSPGLNTALFLALPIVRGEPTHNGKLLWVGSMEELADSYGI